MNLYIVVEHHVKGGLEAEVNKKLALGYVLCGGICVDDRGNFFQAMSFTGSYSNKVMYHDE